jgi:hypothetical protein
LLVILCTLVAVTTLAIPMFVMRPFVPQAPRALALALGMRAAAPWLSAACALIAALAIKLAWSRFGLPSKIMLPLLLTGTIAAACLAHINIFEIMFKPYPSPAFTSPADAKIDPDDKVLAATFNGESHAYPIRTMGYHHIVNDVVAGEPIAATYCTLCHTGLVWSRRMIIPSVIVAPCDCILTFRLAGINNGNALMRDEQTNSIWQQSTGEAIFGSLKGQHLTLVHSDELTFALWRSEQPKGLVLKPEAKYESEYDPKDWESHIARTRTVVDTSKSGIGPHELMLGVTTGGESRAYPLKTVLAAGLIAEDIAAQPIVIVVGPDHASIRVFNAKQADDTPLGAFVPSSGQPGEVMKDTASGSTFNFEGCAISGKYAGQCLTPVDSHKDYWFDWLNHNPSTTVFKG